MAIEQTTRSSGFREAERHLAGLTARAEKRALLWLAPRTPGWVTSDHLTLLGLGAMAACGALYALAGRLPWLLLLVNAALALNWLGDSLDGTLARHRRVERPRFGFYVDHLADAFGALFVLGGLALSGLMSPLVAAAFLAAYYLLAIETYLATLCHRPLQDLLGTLRRDRAPDRAGRAQRRRSLPAPAARGRIVLARLRRPGRGWGRSARRPRDRGRDPGHARPGPRRRLGPAAPAAHGATGGGIPRRALRGRGPLLRLSVADAGTPAR